MKRQWMAAVAVSAAFVLSACGGQEPAPGTASAVESAEEAAERGAGELTTIQIAETAGVPMAFLQYGEELGIFERHGLDLDLEVSVGGAAVIPALVGGNLDIGGSNVVSAMLAGHQGLPISIIAPGTFASDDAGSDFSAVLVSPDSGVASAEGLIGGSIAVNTLENIGDITISAALEARGLEPGGVQFVELGFADMLPALANGQVDAVWIIEPFLSVGVEQGNIPVLRPYAEAREGLQVGAYLSTQEFVAANPDVVSAFRAAAAETAEAINADPDAFRAALPALQELDPDVAATMVLPRFSDALDVESLEFIAERMLHDGVINSELDVASLVAD